MKVIWVSKKLYPPPHQAKILPPPTAKGPLPPHTAETPCTRMDGVYSKVPYEEKKTGSGKEDDRPTLFPLTSPPPSRFGALEKNSRKVALEIQISLQIVSGDGLLFFLIDNT